MSGFTEKDQENLVGFLNFVGSKAKFELNTQEVISLMGYLTWAQKELLPKVKSHILEFGEVKRDTPKPRGRGKAKTGG